MKHLRIRSLIAGIAASTAIGIAGQSAIAQHRVNNDMMALGGMAQARAELAARLSETSAMQKGRASLKARSDQATKLVSELSDERVLSALGASSPEALEAAIFGSQASRDLLQSLIEKGTSVAGTVKALGAAGSDLVFTPVTPCRIMDTRFWAAGPLTANTDRAFDIDSTDISTQTGGQTVGGCGIPAAARGISVNITVIGAGTGFLYIWQDTAAQPNASIINWSPATAGPIANAAVVPIFPSNPAGHILASGASVSGTHVIMDVLGYFAPPFQTALDCVNVAMTGATASQTGLRTITAQCGAGYTVVGGSCDTSNSAAGPITGSRFTAANGWTCESNNYPANVTAFSISGNTRCCAVPGR